MNRSSPYEPFTMSERNQLIDEEEEDSNSNHSVTICRKRCPRILIIVIAVYITLLIVFLGIALLIRKESSRPHVIFVIADDMGWSDVQWNDADMRTPVLRGLLAEGVLLNNSYVHPLDSPSRAAIFTGMYPYHMGLQHETMAPDTPTFLPLTFPLLPHHLHDYGYRSHLVGKWHLGFCGWQYTPTNRGFQSFSGFYTDSVDYYSHRDSNGYYDFRRGEEVDMHAEGAHSTHVLTDRAMQVIHNHDVSVPLFLLISFQALHSPVQVPDVYLKVCSHITQPSRQKMCALTAMLDEGIGNVTSTLRDKSMLRDAVIIVTSDNGGVTSQGSSNGPFRGGHGDVYDGGTRTVSLISSPFLLKDVHGGAYSGLFHQVDWLPTLVSMVGGVADTLNVDGVSQWEAIRTGNQNPRNEIIYNIDDSNNSSAIRVHNYKLIVGSPNITHHHHQHPPDHPGPVEIQLYDLSSDPGETTNLADSLPKKVKELQERLEKREKGLVPAVNKPADPRADPSLWDGVWSPGWC